MIFVKISARELKTSSAHGALYIGLSRFYPGKQGIELGG